ncbi:MAG: ABC transporter ATP-binding protein/permease [Hyphomicrobiales bacterium]|nr:ABC transporter ATP-binding protein/permease [Hyphomicrobiales bacterium]MCA1998201.1 ABC transporter ATP-binding protein/permease [Hyphomicrobiales bacterium]
MRSQPFPRLLAFVVGAVSLLALGLGLSGAQTGVPAYVAASGLVLAAGMLVAPPIGAFLRFFVLFYGIGYVGLVALFLAQPVLPGMIQSVTPPPLTAFTAACFGILALSLQRIPVMRTIFSISDPYFETDERRPIRVPLLGMWNAPEKWVAFALLGIIILINLGQVGISVRLSFWSRDWLDSIQNKNAAEFWRLLFQVWVPWVFVLIVSNMIEYVLLSVFKIRWREWTTLRLIGRWLDGGTHYRLQFNGGSVDNPDQRIQEDVRKYIDTTYALTISMIQQLSTLISFSVILWGLSSNLTIPGTDTKLPGLLFWIALLYAGLGTIVAHLIGRRLIHLNFQQEQYEANFRFSLARLREYAEPIALLAGEDSEKNRLGERFRFVISNFFRIVGVQKWLSAFTQFYGSSNSVIPYVVAAPFYFVGQISLGVLNQTAGAFGRVDAALAFFIDRYAMLADFKAVVDRLAGFDASIHAAIERRETSRIARLPAAGPDLRVADLALGLPEGRMIARIRDLVLRRGERTLLVGPSGSGKSTLFRAIAGIWPFGAGTIEMPAGQTVMLLPQRPYIPIGTLRGAISYPAIEGRHPDAAICAALDAARLPQLKDRLEEEANWSQILSGGEQQRLAIARALLERPDWLFLDEATAALDEPLEEAIYAALAEALPATTIVSIGHRSSLNDNHDRRIEMRLGADETYLVAEYPLRHAAAPAG